MLRCLALIKALGTHLQHELALDLGLSETVNPYLLYVNIVIHNRSAPFLIHQIFCLGIVEYRAVQTDVYLVDPAMSAFSYRAGHLPLKGHPDLLLRHSALHRF